MQWLDFDFDLAVYWEILQFYLIVLLPINYLRLTTSFYDVLLFDPWKIPRQRQMGVS